MFSIKSNNNGYQDKVVITGIGVISPIGIGKEAFWQSLKNGRSGIKPITLFDTSTTHSKLAGEISDFKPEEILGSKGLRNLDRTTKLVVCAAKLALNDANLTITPENTDDIGVVLGSTMGSVWSISEFDKEAIRNGPRAVNPALFANTVINSPASQISIWLNIKGFNSTISSGFTSSLDALEYAKNFILMNRAECVLVGGVEELCEQTFKGFYKLGFLSGSKQGKIEFSAPFDRRRNGAVLGEGAAIIVLERLDRAVKRGVHIYGAVQGNGHSFDKKSFNQYDLNADGAKRAIVRALQNAAKSPDDIDYVAMSANSTLDGDVAEARALQWALRGRKRNIVGSACKSMTGETYSAGGAMQLASSFLVIEQGIFPPTINFEKEDRRCQIDCVPNIARRETVKTVLVSCVSPTGQSSAAVISHI